MEHPVQTLAELGLEDPAFDERWRVLGQWFEAQFGRTVSVDGLLFLMGLHVQGRSYEPDLPKPQKQDLIMEGSYCALATLGFYEQVGMEQDGAWIWERILRLPKLSVDEQERLLRMGILRYFDPIMVQAVEGFKAPDKASDKASDDA